MAKSWDVMGFGERCAGARKALRRRLGRRVRQTDLGKELGVGDQTISNWENGTNPPRSLDALFALAAALEVEPQWLIFGTGPMVATDVPEYQADLRRSSASAAIEGKHAGSVGAPRRGKRR